MKNVQSYMMVLSKGSIWGSAYDMDTLNSILTSLAKEHGEGVMRGAKILNVLHETYADAFPLEKVEGEIYFNEMNFPYSEGKFILHDYNDREFDDSDELNEFVKREIERGTLTIDEANCLDITYKEECKPDMNIAKGEDEWRLKVEDFESKHRDTMDMMAIEYVPEDEALKTIRILQQELQEERAAVRPMEHTPDIMSDDEIAFEINKLEVRITKLLAEQRLRKVAKDLITE